MMIIHMTCRAPLYMSRPTRVRISNLIMKASSPDVQIKRKTFERAKVEVVDVTGGKADE